MSKVMGIFVKFWHSCHVTQDADFETFLFCPNSIFNIRKVTKFLVEKLSTSKVISQKPHGGGGGGRRKPSIPVPLKCRFRFFFILS